MDSDRVTESISSLREKHVVESFGGGKELCNYDEDLLPTRNKIGRNPVT